MTGYFIRTTINGKPTNIEIEKLTDQQLNEFVSKMDSYEAKRWLTALVIWIRDNVKERSKREFDNQIYGELP